MVKNKTQMMNKKRILRNNFGGNFEMLYLLRNRFGMSASLSTGFSPQLTLTSKGRMPKWIFG